MFFLFSYEENTMYNINLPQNNEFWVESKDQLGYNHDIKIINKTMLRLSDIQRYTLYHNVYCKYH